MLLSCAKFYIGGVQKLRGGEIFMKKLIVLSLAALILVSGMVSFSGLNASEKSKSVKIEKHSKVKAEKQATASSNVVAPEKAVKKSKKK